MARSAPDKPNDPRLRPFRTAAYGFYLVVVSAFCLLVIHDVFSSVFAMSPGRKPAAEPTYTFRECLDGADGLWREMDEHRRELTARSPIREADAEWSRYRVGWIQRLRELEAHCAPESHSREALKDVFERLDQVMNLYTTHAVQFAGQMGGAVDGLRQSIEQARRDPAAGRLP